MVNNSCCTLLQAMAYESHGNKIATLTLPSSRSQPFHFPEMSCEETSVCGSDKVYEEKYMKQYRGSRIKRGRKISAPDYCRKLPVLSDKLLRIAPGKRKFLS